MKRLILINCILFHFFANAQKTNIKDPFNFKITEVKGDLNNDKLDDKVIVMQDTVSEIAPFRLEIFFVNSKGDYKRMATSTKIIAPQHPNGRDGFLSGNSLENITIKKNILIVNYGLLRGNLVHKFRFQNGNFELIGYSAAYLDNPEIIRIIDFNLSTGIRVEKLGKVGSDEVKIKPTKKIVIRPLPKIEDVEPFENDLY
ncbi:hypothetical protein HNQ02_003577 [Flavobacterium sp. 7E]|uniref:hypothetical protein n=1 Tax=Flavobacterium sp. 7E TaxID=2735898 RepID=UPI0015708020|nr:hypothetical protein [Flavobacterium sp. 7E]NRS90631.1 hypothetical protein [Flavobacterium sp. 7E]